MESEIGYRLPPELRQLYLFSNGARLLRGNLNFYPLRRSEERKFGLSDTSARLREWMFPVPEEVLVFADNGSESNFGIWLPEVRNETFRNPIIEIAEPAERCMTVVGTSFMPFLLGCTAYYLMLSEADSIALDAIGIPSSLRGRRRDDELFADLCRWADPTLPDYHPDAYQKGYTAEDFRKLFGGT